MARRLFVCLAVLGCGLLLRPVEVKATTYPNSYASTRSYRYDPTVGAAGTLYITVSVTGAMQQNPGMPCSTQHTPSVNYKRPDGSWTGYVYGDPTSACSNMTFSHVFSFDLDVEGCHLIDLYSGTCQFEEEMDIHCPVMGLFLIKWMDIQIGMKITYSWVSALVKSNGWHPEAAYCSDASSPPDWKGPFEASPNTASGEYAGAEEMWREVPWGQSFNGVPWNWAFSYISQPYVYPTDPTPPNCTNTDKGFKNGVNVFWPLPGIPF